MIVKNSIKSDKKEWHNKIDKDNGFSAGNLAN